MKRRVNEENIKELIERKGKFLQYSEYIKEKFGGPSSYFYIKTIKNIRNSEYETLFSNDSFLEYLYATLATWGMHRSGKNTRMADFEKFKDSIVSNKYYFLELSEEKLRDVDIENINKNLIEIFNNVCVMSRKNAPKLVANSKIMHFLLPDLIPPMDKGNVIFFFYGEWRTKKDGGYRKYIPKINNEEEMFIEVLKHFRYIADELNLKEKDLKNDWDTSIPKIIDNAIIGYNNLKPSH